MGGATKVDLGETAEDAAVSLTRAGLSSLFAYMDEALVCCDHQGTIGFAGGSFTDLFGYDAESLVGRCVLDFVDPADHARLTDNLARWVGRSGAPRGTVVSVRAADGTWLPVRYDTVVRDDLAPLGPIAITLVPAEAASAEERERRSRLLGIDRLVRLASTFLQVPHDEFDRGIDAAVHELAGLELVTRASVWRSDGHRVVLRGSWTSVANAPAVELSPRARIDDLPSLRRMAGGEEVGLAPSSGPEPEAGVERELYEAAGTTSSVGVPMMSGDRFIGFVLLESTVGDITVSASHWVTARAAAAILAEAFVRHDAEVQLADQARTDRVTGLANRWAFDEAIAGAQADVAAGVSRGLALVLLDLDRFKLVNDSLGHAAGDLLLADVAARFSAAADEGTTVARLGGDELLALLRDEPDVESAGARATGLLSAFATPFDVGGEALVLTASAGVAHTVDPTTPAGELMRRADVAMYRAKARGGDAVELDDPSRPSGSSTLRREAELRRAVEERELVTFVQGEWDLLTGELLGAEALVRWQHPEEGLLSALDVIPLAETCGLIDAVGCVVLADACRMAVPWREALGPGFVVRVNLSAHQLRRGDLADQVDDALLDSGLPADALCLELTESSLLVDPTGSAVLFEQLREVGVGLAIDDFGTGYSSILQLKRLPLTALKVDRTFVMGLPDDPTDRAIVDAVVQLSGALGITVTAEGVETEEQRDALVALGCRRAQGFLYSRPEPEAAFAARVEDAVRV